MKYQDILTKPQKFPVALRAAMNRQNIRNTGKHEKRLAKAHRLYLVGPEFALAALLVEIWNFAVLRMWKLLGSLGQKIGTLGGEVWMAYPKSVS